MSSPNVPSGGGSAFLRESVVAIFATVQTEGDRTVMRSSADERSDDAISQIRRLKKDEAKPSLPPNKPKRPRGQGGAHG